MRRVWAEEGPTVGHRRGSVGVGSRGSHRDRGIPRRRLGVEFLQGHGDRQTVALHELGRHAARGLGLPMGPPGTQKSEPKSTPISGVGYLSHTVFTVVGRLGDPLVES